MKGLEKPYQSPAFRPRGDRFDDQFRYIDDRVEGLLPDDPVEEEEDDEQ